MHNTNASDNGTKLDALLFFIRKYGRNLLIAILSLVVLYFVFYFLIEDLTLSALTVRRVDSTTASEAFYCGLPQSEGENFINLNGTHVLKNGKRVNCDLLMLRKDEEYGDNYFGFDTELSDGECAVSNNLMKSYGLKVGDTLSIKGTDKTYKIKTASAPSKGLDSDYMHDGTIFLGYSAQVLDCKDYSYLAFIKDGDGISDLRKIVFLSREREAAVSDFAIAFSLAVMFFALTVFLWELLLGRRSYSDLRRFAELGAKPITLYFRVLLGILFKYFLPAVLVFLIWHSVLGCYLGSYIFPALMCISAHLLILVIYSVLLFRRVSLCRMKRK